jgi:uncharacterized repeat protein (TIGR01451 family)
MIRRVLVLATLVFFGLVASALAHSPNPIPGTETATTASVAGGIELTVSGQWSWTGKNGSCDNKGQSNPPQGVAVAWNDPSAPGNLVANDPNPPNEPVLVGTPTDNQVHVNPCGTFDSATNATVGTWGPLTHVYPRSTTGSLHICPVTYHIRGGNTIAGGPGHQDDNSIETNGAGVDVGCFTFSFPSLTTTASGPVLPGNPISDVAHLSGGTSPTGTITFTAYGPSDPTCSATPVYTSSAVPVNGNGDYTSSPPFTPTAPGIYRWIAVYSGDSHNSSEPTACNDSGEQTVVTAPAPAISLLKQQKIDGTTAGFTHDQLTGDVGQKVDYQMTVTNTGNAVLALTFSDPVCDAGTLSGPTGNLDASGDLPPGASTLYTCSHVLVAGDRPQLTNVATVTGTPPPNQGPPVSAHDQVVTVVTPPPAPGMTVVKEQRDASSTSPFTAAPITANIGDTVLYEMIVSNTGDVPLTLAFSDPHCDSGTLSGPVGDVSNGQLAAHGTALYNCSHLVAAADVPQFTNVVTVTGTPPSGPPVGPISASVVANIPQAGTAPSCTVGPVALQGAVGCTRRAFTAIVQGTGIKSVTFFMDGKKVRTVTAPNHNGRFGLRVVPSRLRFGGHVLTARVTLNCNGQQRTVTLHFRHCKPPKPRFTG